jgi:competence protein ComEC
VQFLMRLVVLCCFAATALADKMTAHYIDIGQGDATLLEFDCGVVMIDVGAQGRREAAEYSAARLMNYLDDFFASRSHLNNTIDSVLITHNHNDHTYSLNRVYAKYAVKNLVTTTVGLGTDVRNILSRPDVNHRYLTYADALDKLPHGLSYPEIDPFNQPGCNPNIQIFTGAVELRKDVIIDGKSFTKDQFNGRTNQNDNSLVIKVEYGEASFLFTGDLQVKGIEYLLANYRDHLDVLDVDVYYAGHHGSHYATTEGILSAMTPEIAVISAGHASDRTKTSAWSYGIPDRDIVARLSDEVTIERGISITGEVFTGGNGDNLVNNPIRRLIDKAVYCTCWDATVVIEADTVKGTYSVRTNQ